MNQIKKEAKSIPVYGMLILVQRILRMMQFPQEHKEES